MDEQVIDQALAKIRSQLHLSQEAETEILGEIRTHLEEARHAARMAGEDEGQALERAVAEFGGEEVGQELQQAHAGWESIEALAATGLPVLLALVLRWLVFVPQGSYRAWGQIFSQPAFWGVALAALLLPALLFRRWQFTLVSWGIFWLISVVFIVIPHAYQW
jgi:hypothetical protein